MTDRNYELEESILRALAGGWKCELLDKGVLFILGSMRAASNVVEVADIEDLADNGLARIDAGGRVTITDLGRAAVGSR